MSDAIQFEPALAEAARWLVRLREQPSAAELAEFRIWLAEPAHATAMDAVSTAWTLGGAAPPRVETAAPARRRVGLRAAAIAASLLLLAALGIGGQELTAETRTYRTQAGERLDVTLADGSSLRLEPDTTIAARVSWLRRTARLERGEVRLDVRPERFRRFQVDAGTLAVRVLGTSFVVATDPARSRVVLISGQVSVVDAQGSELQRLTPGQQASWTPAGRVTVQQADLRSEQARLSGQVVFTRAKLGDAIAQLTRESNVRVEFASNDLAALEVSGVFTTGDLRVFLDSLAAIHPVTRSTRSDGTIVLAWRKENSRH